MRRFSLLLVLLLLTACSSPNQVDLGPDVTRLVSREFEGGVAQLGSNPSGEWVLGVNRGGKPETQNLPAPTESGRPIYKILANTAVVVGKAPPEAVQFELVNEARQVLKGKVEQGVYLIAWPTGKESPAFILRILDAKGNEIYRWPPPGGLPAA